MNTFHIRTFCCLLAAITTAGMVGCERHDAATYIASADSYIAKSDYKAAIIQIKNALKQSQDNGQARLMLAKSLYATGDTAGTGAWTRDRAGGTRTRRRRSSPGGAAASGGHGAGYGWANNDGTEPRGRCTAVRPA